MKWWTLLAAAVVLTGCARLNVQGSIQKVRVYSTDEKKSAVVVDFRLDNPSKLPLVVRDVVVEVETGKGRIVAGDTVADRDAERFLAARPELGPKFNPTLTIETRLRPGESNDYMIAAGFDLAEAEINSRKGIRLRVIDADGPVFEFAK